MKPITTIIILTIAIVASGCGWGKKPTSEVTKIENVKVLKIEKKEVTRNIEYSASLEGYETLNVSTSIQGIIEHIYVEAGSMVKTGQLLVKMDGTQLNTQKMALANLGVEKSRIEALYQSGNVTQQLYDQTQTQYNQLSEQVAFLQKNTFVKAPFSGVISVKNFENGELFSPVKPILILAQLTKLKAFINIPETYAPKVKEGMQIDIVSEIYPQDVFRAKIEMINLAIDPVTHTFQVKIVIPNPNNKLRPGMFVRTTLSLGKSDAIIVPYQSIIKQQGSNDRYVFVNKDGTAKRINVSLGQRFDDNTEIISDSIEQGDELVVVGQARLIDGAKLNVERIEW